MPDVQPDADDGVPERSPTSLLEAEAEEPSAARRFQQRFFPDATAAQWNDWRWQLRNRIRDLAQSQVHAVIDLAGVTPGERTFDLTSHHISLPRNTEVVQVVPTQFRLTFDKRVSRELEVHPRVLGTFPPGFHLQSAVPDPVTVTVVGPEKRVKALDAALTDPVDASGVIGRATFTTNVYVSDPLIRVTRNESVRVTVTTERSPR